MILQGTDNSTTVETNLIEEEAEQAISDNTEYGINAPKLDAPIAIRGTVEGGNFYTTYLPAFRGTTGATITCGFKPQMVYIDSINTDIVEDENSKSWTIEETDGTLTTTAFYQDGAQLYTLGSGDSSTVEAVYVLYPTYGTQSAFITEFTSTGFTLGSGTGGRNTGLHITVMG